MTLKRFLLFSAIAAGCFAGIFLLDHFEPLFLSRLRNLERDQIARAGRTAPASPNLVFLAIDSDSVTLDPKTDVGELYGLTTNNSIEARGLKLMTSSWPWPREVYALILDRLIAAGAAVVAFDLTFPTATPDDAILRAALERHRGKVVVGSNFISAASRGLSIADASLTRPSDTLIPQTSPMDDRVAFSNFWPDEDEVVRAAFYRITFEQVRGDPPSPESERYLSFGSQILIKAGYAESVPQDLERHLFRYTAPPRQGYVPHSLFEIFVPDYWKNNYRSGEFFRNKIVVVGAEGNWQHDEQPTPFGSMPGPELHLNAINAALQHQFIAETPPRVVLLAMIWAGVIAVGLSLLIPTPWLRLLILLVTDVGCVLLAVYVYDHASFFLPIAAPGLELNVVLLLGLAADFTLEQVDKRRVRQTLERYVSRDVVREMLDRPKLYEQALGGVTKRVTILFSDIRSFSRISSESDPHLLVSQLNEYLTAMVECVFRFGGTLDKFMGDAVMAVWGNVRSEGPAEDAVAAVQAALAMRQELARLNEKWASQDLPSLQIGIALNHGPVIAGNIGSPQRMEFTVIGEAVNVTWRMQELTKTVGAELVVSKTVEALIVEHFELRSLGRHALHNVPGEWDVFAISRPITEGTRDAVTPAVVTKV